MNRRRIAILIVLACLRASAQAPLFSEIKEKAASGDAHAQFQMGLAYAHGSGVEQDDSLAVKWYRAAAEQGEPEAQNELGIMYQSGRGVEKDKAVAVQWWRKAAAHEHGPSRFNLAASYFNGDGVEVNDQLAYAWFVLASAVGDKSAVDAVKRMQAEHSAGWLAFSRFKVAEMLERGDGIPADPKAAKVIYENVFNTDTPEVGIRADAHIRIAQMYLDGRGVERDFQTARKHCEAAAKMKSFLGYSCLGVFAEGSDFGAPDYRQAAHYYEEAVRLGDFRSMIRLGRLYESGLGVKQDNATALLLYLLGESHLRLKPQVLSETLASKMKPSDILKVRKKASEWHPTMKLP